MPLLADLFAFHLRQLLISIFRLLHLIRPVLLLTVGAVALLAKVYLVQVDTLYGMWGVVAITVVITALHVVGVGAVIIPAVVPAIRGAVVLLARGGSLVDIESVKPKVIGANVVAMILVGRQRLIITAVVLTPLAVDAVVVTVVGRIIADVVGLTMILLAMVLVIVTIVLTWDALTLILKQILFLGIVLLIMGTLVLFLIHFFNAQAVPR